MATKFITVSIEIMHDKSITATQKFILAEIQRLSLSDKICAASNKHFSLLLGVTKSGVSKAINELLLLGYIEFAKITDKEAYKILNKQNSSIGCIFCGYEGIAIDDHHYPIRAKDGGKKTIKLCANCHREFHFLADHRGCGLNIVWEKIGQTEEEYNQIMLEVQNDK